MPAGAAAAALQQLQSDIRLDYRVAEVTTTLRRNAARLADRHHLLADDAVPLAVALELHGGEPTISLISADVELNSAADQEGLIVDDPILHP